VENELEHTPHFCYICDVKQGEKTMLAHIRDDKVVYQSPLEKISKRNLYIVLSDKDGNPYDFSIPVGSLNLDEILNFLKDILPESVKVKQVVDRGGW
jgi:hypothetical protein